MKTNYSKTVIDLLNESIIDNSQLEAASASVTKCIENDGLIYMFGCGHSHIFGEEFFYRAGGLANVVPILYEPLMLHQGAMQSSVNEKKNNYTKEFIDDYQITSRDVIFVVSTSGINPVPIDVAIHAKKKGATVITISSFTYRDHESSRHVDGLYLSLVGDINIDNKVVFGDASVTTRGIKHSPISTLVGIFILHEIISNAINNSTGELPVFISGNISGSKEHNIALVKKYEKRIPMLSQNLEIEL